MRRIRNRLYSVSPAAPDCNCQGWLLPNLSIRIGNGGVLSTVEEYDPMLDKWTKRTDMPTARMFLTTSVVNGRIYAIGGADFEQWRVLSATEEYDPMKDTWTRKTDIPTARYWMSIEFSVKS